MTLLAPGWLFLGAGAALALVALHLLAVGRPAPWLLPTARFVPVRSARARRLARRPADRLLLALRVAAVLLAALALARPTRRPTRRAIARVVLADVSRAVRDAAEVRDSVRALAGVGDLVIAFDTSAARPVAIGAAVARDSLVGALGGDSTAAAAGSLSAALAAARRAVPTLREAADSVELVIVSPLTAREVDAATLGVRRTWAGRARIARVGAAPNDSGASSRGVVRGGPADDVLAAVANTSSSSLRSAGGSATRPYRIVRDGVAVVDSAWARDSAGIVLDWPASGMPAGWTRRTRVDTVGAVVALPAVGAAAAFVAPLARTAVAPRDGIFVARWADGEPAAVERAVGRGCVRAVAVTVPQVGDVALRAPFRAFLAALTGPCAASASGAPLDSSAVRRLAGAGPLLATSALEPPAAPRDPLARWLLAGALLLLLAELPVRAIGRPRDETPDAADAPPVVTAPREAA